jgi:formamidopyrimidine-DNA glycosylase
MDFRFQVSGFIPHPSPMPELPEVEVLVRHLRPLLKRRTIRGVDIRRLKSLGGTPARTFVRTLTGATFADLHRRGKYLIFHLRPAIKDQPPQSLRLSTLNPQLSTILVGHLGMTGRMYLLPRKAALPRHAAVVLNLGRENFVFEDTRYFGRLTLETGAVEKLGPEPLDGGFNASVLQTSLNRSRQPIKVKLLDQTVVAGIGNIYASEALFRSGISPRARAGTLGKPRLDRLCVAIREVLNEAIAAGSTIPLNFSGNGKRDGLFYYGTTPEAPQHYEERLLVYDRKDQPCVACSTPIRRITQGSRSTFFCPRCQRT